MLNNPSFGSPKLPTRKATSEHRQQVEDRALGMINELRDAQNEIDSEPAIRARSSHKVSSATTSKTASKKRRHLETQPVDAEKQYLVVPMSYAAHHAFESVLSAAPDNEKGALRRRLIERARDSFIAKKSVSPWSIAAETQLNCAIRIPSALIQEVLNRDDPAGLRAVSVVIGRAFAPHLDATLAPLIQKPK